MNLSFTSCKLIFLTLFTMQTFAQQVLPLYPGKIPNSKPAPNTESSAIEDSILIVSDISRPTLTVYLPEKSKQQVKR